MRRARALAQRRVVAGLSALSPLAGPTGLTAWIAIAALMAICTSCGDASNPVGVPSYASPFIVEEVLVNPTETTVQLAVYPRGAAAVFVEYWEAEGG